MASDVSDLYAQAQAAREQSMLLFGRLEATRRQASESWQLIQVSWHQAERIRARRLLARTDPDRLRYSAYARLQAQLASLPVIEQAKGIIMARNSCSEEQAFDALRRASQRKNIKVRDLAAFIVASTARPAGAKPPPAPRAQPARTPRAQPVRTPRAQPVRTSRDTPRAQPVRTSRDTPRAQPARTPADVC
jgi:ANTAR domain